MNLGYPVSVGFFFHFFPPEPLITKEPFLQWNRSFDDKWHMFRTDPLPVNSVELLKGTQISVVYIDCISVNFICWNLSLFVEFISQVYAQ